MPSIRLSSLAGTGLFTRGAWRSMEASSAPMAKRRSAEGGVASARVGRKPRSASARPIPNNTTIVTMTPRMNPRIVVSYDLIEQRISPRCQELVRFQPAHLFDQIAQIRQKALFLRRRKRYGRV